MKSLISSIWNKVLTTWDLEFKGRNLAKIHAIEIHENEFARINLIGEAIGVESCHPHPPWISLSYRQIPSTVVRREQKPVHPPRHRFFCRYILSTTTSCQTSSSFKIGKTALECCLWRIHRVIRLGTLLLSLGRTDGERSRIFVVGAHIYDFHPSPLEVT